MIRRLLSVMMLVAAIGCAPALGATHSCTTVDKSAKAFVASGTSVSIEEKDRNCTFSVNGATSMEPQSFWWDAFLTTRLFIEGGADIPRETIFDLIVGPFATEGDRASRRAEFLRDDDSRVGDISKCLNSFAAIVRDNRDLSGSRLSDPSSHLATSPLCSLVVAGSTSTSEQGFGNTMDFSGLAIKLESNGGIYFLHIPSTLMFDLMAGSFGQ